MAGAPQSLIRRGRGAPRRRRSPQRSPKQYSEPSREPMITRPFHITGVLFKPPPPENESISLIFAVNQPPSGLLRASWATT